MKLNRLETHDRYEHFIKDQAINISQGCEDCLKKNPLSLKLQEKSPYIYIFAHPRTADDGFTKRMLWQPRLTRPRSQTNSYLFRAQSKSDLIEVCWILPPREMWSQYKEGNVTHSDIVLWSIDQFTNNREKLDQPISEDLSEETAKNIYRKVVEETENDLKLKT